MKKTLLTKTLLLLFALIAGSSSSWAVTVTWERVTSISTLTSGGTFIIGYEAEANSGVIIPMANTGSATTSAAGFMYSGSTATSGGTGTIDMSSVATTTAYEVEIGASTKVDGAIYIKVGSNYLGNENTKNNCKWYAEQSVNTSFTPTIGDNNTFTLDIEANNSGSKYRYLKYNTGSPRFAVYATTPDKIVIYKKVITNTATLDHIVLGGTYQTEFYVGDTFTHDGLTVTAHYDDASSLDVTSSATFSDPDMSVAGTKTITVSYEDNSITKTATYDITVSPTPPVVLTLDFGTNIFGLPVGSSNKLTASTGYTYGGYTYTLAATNGFYYGEFTGYNCLFMGKSGATLTFPAYPFKVKMIKVYGTSGASASVKQNIFVGDDAISTETTGAKDVVNKYYIPSAYQVSGTQFVLKVTSDANTQISKIEILGDDAAPAFVGASGWSTLYCTAGLDFAKVDGLEAYVVSAVSASSVTLSDAIPHAPAGTAVILKGTPNTAYTVPVFENNYDFGTNKLLVSDGSVTGGDGIYALAEKNSVVGFYKVAAGVTIPAGKCYLNTAAGAPDFLGFDDNATGIDEVRGKTEEVRGEFYNLAGQRVAQPTKGLYIVNGKKVVMK